MSETPEDNYLQNMPPFIQDERAAAALEGLVGAARRDGADSKEVSGLIRGMHQVLTKAAQQ